MPSAGGLSIVIAFFNCDSHLYSYVDIHYRTNQKLPILIPLPVVAQDGLSLSQALIDDVKELVRQEKMIGILLAVIWSSF